MNFIRNRNFRVGSQTSLEGVICPQNSDKQQKNRVFGRSVGGLMEYYWCAFASNLLYGQSYLITIGFAILSCHSILMVSIILYRVWPISSLLIFCGKHSLLLLMVLPYIKNILSLMR